MKNKKRLFILMPLILVGCLFTYRYYQVNKNFSDRKIVTQHFIRQNQIVETPNITFSIMNSHVESNEDAIEGNLDLKIIKLENGTYGFKDNNKNIIENMFFACSNGFIFNPEYSEVSDYKEILNGEKDTMKISFNIPKKVYKLKNNNLHFSFLISEGKNKYIDYTYIVSPS